MGKVEVAASIQATLGEGPIWDERENVLYWVDILEKRIYRYEPDRGNIDFRQLDQYVGAVVPHSGGGFLFAGYNGIYTFDFASGNSVHVASPSPVDPDLRFNDGKCDPKGRFWAGTISLTGRQEAAALYRLDPDGSLHTMLQGVSISNGLGYSPDGQTMYYIDTPTLTVAAFDMDMETGNIHNKRIVVRFAEGEGSPDGMTVDEEGMLWIAHWGGYQVSRWDPASGKKLSSVRLPVPHVTSCVFGGEERNELYITSARVGLNDKELAESPLSGSVFKVKTDVKGARTYAFGRADTK